MLVVSLACVQNLSNAQVKVGDAYPTWTKGYMEIHHINTGKGEGVFAILPDGTTMLIDAGDAVGGPSAAPPLPNGSKTPGEWISRYILRMMKPLPEKKIDYLFSTHLHDDHMGAVQPGRLPSKKGDYILSGITEIGDRIPFGKIVDRGWPDYNYPVPLKDKKNIRNYIQFVNTQIAQGTRAEQFVAGSNQQFKLLKQPDQFPEFEIRNIAVNGQVWTGTEDKARNYFPPLESLPAENYPSENQCSAAIRISYGNFDYFNGGDLVHSSTPVGGWQNIETPVGRVTGPVEVCEANHHGYYDAMGEEFLMAVRPRVIIIQALGATHPNYSTYMRMLESSKVYPGERDIFTTNLLPETKAVFNEKRARLMKSQQGHVVVRVQPGGDKYDIYILDDATENFTIKAIHGPYESQ